MIPMAASGDTTSHGSVTAKDQLRSVKRQRVRRNTRKRDQRSEDRWLDAEAKEKLDAEVTAHMTSSAAYNTSHHA